MTAQSRQDLVCSLIAGGATHVACIDEAGRGPVAGPVHVGVVVLNASSGRLEGVNDSKLLRADQRARLYDLIGPWAVATAVAAASASEIDDYGIMRCLRLATRRALAMIDVPIDAFILDGNFDFLNRPSPVRDEPELRTSVPVHTVVGADRLIHGVGAASILAKHTRDQVMMQLDRSFPGYGWAKNMGYGTKEQLAAIELLGLTDQHRRTFRR